MSNLTFMQKVAKIQKELKAPKSQTNKFGNYNYRNCEDILEAVKPLLGDLVLTVSDEVVAIGNRIYVKATASITDGTNILTNTAFAREPDEQKGMSASQLTGTASSYARKYSLNGLFLIDDTKDADTDEFQGKSNKTPESQIDHVPKQKVVLDNLEPQLTVATPKKSGPWGKKTTPKADGDLY
jgi:hypothetical protein